MELKNCFRTNSCGEIGLKNVGEEIKVSGWVENIRDFGQPYFFDLRDH